MAPSELPVSPVSRPVQREVTDHVDFTGRTEAVQSVDIRPRVTGYLVSMPFKEGAIVKAGDLLFEIDPRPYQAQLDSAQGQVNLYEAQLQLAKITYARDVALNDRVPNSVSQQELDQVRATVDEAEARVKSYQKNMEVYKLNHEFTKVVSPIDGQVSRYYLTLGNLVNQDQTLLTTVVSLDPLYAYFEMDEPTLLRIRRAINEGRIKRHPEGTEIPVMMGLQGEDGFPHQGTINFVNNQVDPTTGSILARGVFPNPQPPEGLRLLSPGMFVRIRLPIGLPHPALLVIDRAVGSDQGLKFVYVVDAQNKVQYRRVTTRALQSDGLRVIESGLKPDEWVVVGGLPQVRPRHAGPARADADADSRIPVGREGRPPTSPPGRSDARRLASRTPGRASAMISPFFIDRPIFATVLSIVITLIGGIALFSLPIAQYPRITPPGVQVSISYPGASAQVVADTVAAPIEQQVNGVQGMLYMSSQMGNDGSYTLTVTFDVDTDLNTALVMVQNRVTLAMPQLPTAVQNQGITIRKKTPDILMIVNFFSPDDRYDDIYLSNFATINVQDELLRVDGVSDINYLGQRDYSIRVWLDPQKLASRNMTAMDVANAIRSQNLDAPAGQIGQPPIARGRSLPVADRHPGPAQRARAIRRHHRQGRRRAARPDLHRTRCGHAGDRLGHAGLRHRRLRSSGRVDRERTAAPATAAGRRVLERDDHGGSTSSNPASSQATVSNSVITTTNSVVSGFEPLAVSPIGSGVTGGIVGGGERGRRRYHRREVGAREEAATTGGGGTTTSGRQRA